MKTTYINPKIEVSDIESKKVFCASGNEDFGKGSDYGMGIFEMASPAKWFSIAFLAMLLLGSCSLDNLVPKESKTYRGTIEPCETRTYVTADGDVLHVNWRSGDQIAITDGTDTAVYAAEYGGSNTTSFSKVSGTDPTGVPTAYYPATIAAGTLPAVQKYAANNIKESPMVGTIVDDDIAFKNLCGLAIFKISTTMSEVNVKSITVTADKGLSGAFTVVDNAAVVSGSAGVTLACDEPVAIGDVSTNFHMAIPAGEYSTFEVKVSTWDGRSQTLKAKSAIKIERSKYSNISLECNNFVEEKAGVALLPSGPDFATALKMLNNPSADANTVDDFIKKIVFQTGSSLIAGTDIADLSSEEKAYLIWDAGTGTVTVSTRGTGFVLPENASRMFGDFAVLESIENIAALNTENVTDMSYMFTGVSCDTTALTSLDLSTFKTGNVTTMERMFAHSCALTSLNVTGWDTGNVESMKYMFSRVTVLENLDLSNWDNKSCEDFTYMFDHAVSLRTLNLANFNTEMASSIAYMFYFCESLESLDVSSFDTENVTNMDNVFRSCYKLQSLTGLKNFDTSNCTYFRSMFNRCDSLTELDCSSFDVSSSTNCQYMFYKCMSLQKLNVSSFDISGMKASTVAYSMPKLQSIREINFGDSFIPANVPSVPDGFTMYYADLEDESMACQNPTRTVTVYCSSDVANYLVTTDMHYPHNGWHYIYNGIDRIHQPITINLVDWKTNQPINLVWPANEKYPL
ncbi:MAG: BspA family leucine-rich repeat surface protein [Bacteroidales bacterium]|nr:BspA family leucine-rich repeat surface protein [Bacteroidales bacterium]